MEDIEGKVMKNKIILFYIISITLIFSACFSPWAGGEGTLTINIGGGGQARDSQDALPTNGRGNDNDIDNYLHIVTIIGHGGQKHEARFIGSGTASFLVPTGHWHIDVKAYDLQYFNYDPNHLELIKITDKSPILLFEGSSDIDIRIGNNYVTIKMVPPRQSGDEKTCVVIFLPQRAKKTGT